MNCNCNVWLLKKKRIEYNCEIKLYFWDMLFVQWSDLFILEWGQKNKKNIVITLYNNIK